ncbi:MAG: DUF4465 domain-containing protein [Tidjanibacter sp.]|nr:DUF4465 domain-containing protein [Tidjanibacter sp.]
MKKFLICALSVGMLLTACSEDEEDVKVVDFESATLVASTGGNPNTYTNILWGMERATDNGSGTKEFSGTIYSQLGTNFCTYYALSYGYDTWGGWAVSSNRNLSSTEYTNQFSVQASSANKFAVGYYMNYYGTDVPNVTFDMAVNVKSADMTNTVISYDYCSNAILPDFYYNIIVEGYLGTTKTGTLTVNLTDVSDWKRVDFSSLGKVDKLTFTPDSNDVGDWGINVPTYFCLDNLRYTL